MKRQFGKTYIVLLSLAVILGIPFGFLVAPSSAVEYAFTTIDVPGAAHTYLDAINNSGHIVGRYVIDPTDWGDYSFLYVGGNFIPINVPGAFSTEVHGINDSDDIVGGYYHEEFGVPHGFLYAGGSFTTIDAPGGGTVLTGINHSGDTVGHYRDETGWAYGVGFLYSGGNFIPIDAPSTYQMIEPNGINSSNDIVGVADWGFSSFLYTGGNYTPLKAPGAKRTVAWGINDSGIIVGHYQKEGERPHGFLYSGGNFITVDVPGAHDTTLTGINNSGVIVGRFNVDGYLHGFMATPVPTITVIIDVKPDSVPNSINPKSKGKIAVAILSAPTFDAPYQLDQDSLTFGSTGDEQSLAFCNPKPKDVNHDGLKDVVCHFSTQLAEFKCGDTQGIMKGNTTDGIPLEGKDSVRIIPCK